MSGSGPDLGPIQAEANADAGARRVPARDIPVPAGLDPLDAALTAAPYSPAWNVSPADEDAWRDLQRGFAGRLVPALAAIRRSLGVSLTPVEVGGVGAYLLAPTAPPGDRPRHLVFFLHGGGYVLGGGEAGTGEAALLAAYGGCEVLSIDYRVAPDARHPAALDDAAAAWRALVADRNPGRLAIGGLSAGGGLALALALRIKAEGLPLPAALTLGSPWTDLTRTGDSYATNEWLDNVLVSYDGYLSRAARLYAARTDLQDPELSPVYGDLRGLPPTTLATGTRDLFLSNAVRTHRRLRAAGVAAELNVFEGMSHAQFALSPGAPVTREACLEVTGFLDRHIPRHPAR